MSVARFLQTLTAVVGVAATLLSGATPTRAADLEKVRYLLPAPLTLPAFGPWVIAKQLGYYSDAGYDVEFVIARGGVDVAKQIGVGNADIGGAIGDTPILVRANGIPVKAVAVLGGGGLTIVTARPDRGITKIADLKGKKVSVLSFEDTTYYALLGALAKVGLRKSDLDIQAVGPAGVVNLVVTGSVDACACTPDWSVDVRTAVPGAIAMPTLDYFPSMAQAIIASDDAIAKKPKMLQGMITATLRGMKFIMQDPAKAAAIFAAATPSFAGKEDVLTRDFQEYVKRTYEGQKEIGQIDAARLTTVQSFYKEQNLIRSDSPVDTLYTNMFVDAAKL
jgi:NitT/TauT family transport system substrate-binding protein